MSGVTKTDRTAADRLLKAALRKAQTAISAGDVEIVSRGGQPPWTYRDYDAAAVEQMLAEAVRSADLLLDGAA